MYFFLEIPHLYFFSSGAYWDFLPLSLFLHSWWILLFLSFFIQSSGVDNTIFVFLGKNIVMKSIACYHFCFDDTLSWYLYPPVWLIWYFAIIILYYTVNYIFIFLNWPPYWCGLWYIMGGGFINLYPYTTMLLTFTNSLHIKYPVPSFLHPNYNYCLG